MAVWPVLAVLGVGCLLAAGLGTIGTAAQLAPSNSWDRLALATVGLLLYAAGYALWQGRTAAAPVTGNVVVRLADSGYRTLDHGLGGLLGRG